MVWLLAVIPYIIVTVGVGLYLSETPIGGPSSIISMSVGLVMGIIV